jgi:hypothetical protein
MEFWFRRRYNLSPLDPRFLELTPEQIEVEWFSYHYADPANKDEVEDENFDENFEKFEAQQAARAASKVQQTTSDNAGVETGVDEFEDVINDRN